MRIQESSRRIVPACLALAAIIGAAGPSAPPDPLASEIDRWSRYVRTNPSTDDLWLQIKDSMTREMDWTEDAMRAGRRFLAVERLADVQPDLEASVYVGALPVAERNSDRAFEAAWTQVGKELAADLRPPAPAAFGGVTPAVVRAIGEAAIPPVRVYYEASRDYERNTMPNVGFYYLGVARAQRSVQALCRSLSAPSTRKPPPLRSLQGELDSLEGELLAAYRPPASIDRHKEFIAANSTLKEARELDAAGLRYGAMLRYLQAALRAAPLTGRAPVLTAAEAARRLEAMRARLSEREAGSDDSLGMLFLESGEADVAAAAAGKPPTTASAVAADVLPRYLAALEPAKPRPPQPAASVTVTLVRWPYT